MIKAFTPVSVLLVSASFGLKELTRKILLIVSLISFGVALASYGEVEFELIGFLVQVRSLDCCSSIFKADFSTGTCDRH